MESSARSLCVWLIFLILSALVLNGGFYYLAEDYFVESDKKNLVEYENKIKSDETKVTKNRHLKLVVSFKDYAEATDKMIYGLKLFITVICVANIILFVTGVLCISKIARKRVNG